MKGISLYIAKGLTVVLTFISNYLMVRIFSVEEFGQYSFMIGLAGFIAIFSDMGMSWAGPKWVASSKNNEEEKLVIMRALSIKFVTGLVGAAFFFTVILLTKTDSFYTLIIGVLLIFFEFLVPDWIFRGLSKPHFMSFRTILNGLILFLCVVLVFVFKFDSYGIFIGVVLAKILSTSLLMSRLIGYLDVRLLNLSDIVRLRYITEDIRNNFLGMSAIIFLGYSGVIAIAFLNGEHETGNFSSYFTIYISLSSLISITYNLCLPKASTLSEQGFYEELWAISFRFCLSVAVTVFVQAKIIYGFIFPETYEFAWSNFMLIIILYFELMLLYYFNYSFVVEGNFRKFFKSNLLGAIFAVLAYLALIVAKVEINTFNALAIFATANLLILVISMAIQKRLLKYIHLEKYYLEIIVFIGSIVLYNVNVWLYLVCIIFFLPYLAKKLYMDIARLY